MKWCLVFGALLIASCSTDGDGSADVMSDHDASVAAESYELGKDLQSLEREIDTLHDEVDKFDTDDWKDVVPKVKSQLEEVESEFQKLKGHAADPQSDIPRL